MYLGRFSTSGGCILGVDMAWSWETDRLRSLWGVYLSCTGPDGNNEAFQQAEYSAKLVFHELVVSIHFLGFPFLHDVKADGPVTRPLS